MQVGLPGNEGVRSFEACSVGERSHGSHGVHQDGHLFQVGRRGSDRVWRGDFDDFTAGVTSVILELIYNEIFIFGKMVAWAILDVILYNFHFLCIQEITLVGGVN